MNSIHLLRGLATLLALFTTASLHAKPNNVELPLVLESERLQAYSPRLGPLKRITQRPSRLSENAVYELIVVFGFLEKVGMDVDYAPKDYEPVGLHLDSDPDNIRPEIAGRRLTAPGVSTSTSTSLMIKTPRESLRYEFNEEETRDSRSSSTTYSDWELSARIRQDGNDTKTSGTHSRVPLHWMAESLAIYSEKNVLMSARLEKRWCPEFRLNDSPHKNIDALEKLFEKEGIALKQIGDDAYVLVEAPGKEKPFPYASRSRAAQYEAEREAWLVKNEDYLAQGLIYQPTKQSPDAYPKRDVRVRHAAAALAKLTGKEVFVQPWVEKREFDAPKDADEPETPEQELALLTRQLNKASVRIVALNPQSLALVAK